MPKIKLLWLVLALLVGAAATLTGSYSVGMTPTDSSTSSNTTYLLEVYLSGISGGNVPAGSYITVAFPTDYNVSELVGVTGAMADGSATIITLSQSGLTLTVNGAFPTASSDDFALQYNLIGIVNPNRVLTT